jgi:hypothetical protein
MLRAGRDDSLGWDGWALRGGVCFPFLVSAGAGVGVGVYVLFDLEHGAYLKYSCYGWFECIAQYER